MRWFAANSMWLTALLSQYFTPGKRSVKERCLWPRSGNLRHLRHYQRFLLCLKTPWFRWLGEQNIKTCVEKKIWQHSTRFAHSSAELELKLGKRLAETSAHRSQWDDKLCQPWQSWITWTWLTWLRVSFVQEQWLNLTQWPLSEWNVWFIWC